MYPVRAAGNAFCGLIAGLIAGGLIAAGIGYVGKSVAGVDIYAPLSVALFLVVAVGFWWGSLYGEIRGWWISSGGEGD